MPSNFPGHPAGHLAVPYSLKQLLTVSLGALLCLSLLTSLTEEPYHLHAFVCFPLRNNTGVDASEPSAYSEVTFPLLVVITCFTCVHHHASSHGNRRWPGIWPIITTRRDDEALC